jgi:hypothetical protein
VKAVAAVFLAICSAAVYGAEPSISTIANDYLTLEKVTSIPVRVDYEIAVSCVALPKAADAARARSGPHAFSTIVIYMNDLAAAAFRSRAATYPVGAVVVKQKHKQYEADVSGVGGMVKRPRGYDSRHGDWEYFYFEDPKRIESGRIATCVQCHDGARDSDRVFGSWLPGALGR